MTEIFTVFSNAFKEDIASDDDHSDLFKSIQERDWTSALEILKLRPYEAETWSMHKSYDGEIIWNRLPIHQACINNAPVSVMKALIEAYPDSGAAADMNDRVPLHHAAVHGTNIQTVEILLSSCPGSANLVDVYGKTPAMCLNTSNPLGTNRKLHNEMIQLLSQPVKGESVKIISSVVNAFDEDSSSRKQYTELFTAIQNKEWNRTLDLIQKCPSKAEEWSTHVAFDGETIWKRLPIHEACINNAPVKVIQAIFNAHPAGVEAMDLNDRLPLHHAAVHGVDIEVVTILLRAYPDAVEQEDQFGKTPCKCLKSPFHGNTSSYCATMEALSKNPSFYKEIASKETREASCAKEKEVEELRKRLEKESLDKIQLMKDLEETVSRSRFLEETMMKTTIENNRLKNAYNMLQRDYAQLEKDMASSQASFMHLEDEEKETDSIIEGSITSVDTPSRPFDNIVLRERSIQTIRAEVKERETILERALLRARSPVRNEGN